MNWITANNRDKERASRRLRQIHLRLIQLDPDDLATFNERSALIEERAELMFGDKPLSRPRRRGKPGSRKRGHK